MTNDMDTLQDYGIEGAPEEEPELVRCLRTKARATIQYGN